MLVLWSLLSAALLTWGNAGDDHPLSDLGLALLMWLAHASLGLGLAVLATATLQRWTACTGSPVPTLLFGGLLGAVLFTPFAVLLENGAAGVGIAASPDGWPENAGALAVLQLLAAEFTHLAAPFLLLWLAANAAPIAILRAPTGAATESQPAAEAPPPAESPRAADVSPVTKTPSNDTTPAETPADVGLLERLPPALGRRVLALRADLNYLHVDTDLGRTMVLYSLTRASAELGDSGVQVHRSHWVACDAVVQVRQTGDRLVCRLSNGLDVPVSRRRRAEVIRRFGRHFVRRPAADES